LLGQKELENVEHFTYLGSIIITNAARCTRDIKSRLAMVKAAFNKMTLFTSKLDLNLRRKLVRCNNGAYICMVLKIGHFGK
jgi:hypothetical protein